MLVVDSLGKNRVEIKVLVLIRGDFVKIGFSGSIGITICL